MKTFLLISTLVFGLVSSQAVIWEFNLNLTGEQEVGQSNPSTATGGDLTAFGLPPITYDTDTEVLSIAFGWGSENGYNDLLGVFTASHIHGPAPAGQNAGIVVGLATSTSPTPPYFEQSSGGKDGSISTTVDYSTLYAGAEADLLGGLHYVNVHSDTYPGGEIRGQLVPVPEPHEYALMVGLGLVAFAGYRRFKLKTA